MLTVLSSIRQLHNTNSADQFRRSIKYWRYALAEPVDDGSPAELTPVKFVGMDNIRGKTIAITGAARGIGHATAKALLARGARVVIGDRDVDVLESGGHRHEQPGPGVRPSAGRHRPGVVRDVPRQGPHRRRRPHRRADQQRRRDAGRPVPRAIRAGDPLRRSR